MSKSLKASQSAKYVRLSALILAVGASGLIGLKLLFSSSAATITGTSQADLVQIIQDVPGAAISTYTTRDNQGYSMDTMKIIANPNGGYLAVYHASNVVRLATSSDLKNWTFKANLASPATQPTITAAGSGFIVADEYNNNKLGYVHLMYYSSLTNLFAGKFDKQFVAPHTLTTCSEGTPNIYKVTLQPDIAHSTIDMGFHYHNNCDTDREATGKLTNFSSWSSSIATTQNNALIAAAAKVGKTVGGNIGDRDSITFGSTQYSIHEVQYAKGDFSTWRPYLFNFTTGQAQALTIKTHKGSQALANPTITALKGPDGSNGIVVTLYVASNSAGEAGELVYYARTTNPPTPPAPAPSPTPTPTPHPTPSPSPSAHPSTTPSPSSTPATTGGSTTKSGQSTSAGKSSTPADASSGAISPQPASNAAGDVIDPSKVIASDAKVLASAASTSANKQSNTPVRTWIVTLSTAVVVLAIGSYLLHRRHRAATAIAASAGTGEISQDLLNDADSDQDLSAGYAETTETPAEDVTDQSDQSGSDAPTEDANTDEPTEPPIEDVEVAPEDTTEPTIADSSPEEPTQNNSERVIDWSKDNSSSPGETDEPSEPTEPKPPTN